MGAQDILQVTVSGVALGAVYALMALGFSLIYSSLRVINFAHGDMLMLGAVLAMTFRVKVGLPYIVSLVLAALATSLVGMAVERAIFRPLRDFPLLNMILATIGVSITIRALGLVIWGSDVMLFPSVFGKKPVQLGGFHVLPDYLLILVLSLVSIVGLHLFLQNTVTGKAMRGTAQSREAALLMGINVYRCDQLAAAIAAGLGAVAGVLVAPIFFVHTEMGALAGLKGFTAAVLGGFGNLPGAIFGGLLLGLAENLSATFISSAYKDAVAFGILIAVLLFKPTGLTGPKA